MASALVASSIPTVSMPAHADLSGVGNQLGVGRFAQAQMAVAVDHAAESRKADAIALKGRGAETRRRPGR